MTSNTTLEQHNLQRLNDLAARRGVSLNALIDTLLDNVPVQLRSAEAVLESVTDAFFALDNDWRFVYVNGSAETMLRQSRAALLGCSIWEAFPEAVDSTFFKQYHHALATGEGVSFREYYPPLDMWFSVQAYPSDDGLSVYFRDITMDVEQERQMRLRTEALEQVSDAVVILDLSHRITFWNHGAALLYGVSRDEALGRPLTEVYTVEYTDDAQKDQAQRDIETSGVWRGITTHIRRDGTRLPIETSVSVVMDGGTVIGMMGISRDISNYIAKERELAGSVEELERRVQARTSELRAANTILVESLDKERSMNMLKERFISTVSHEFRTPLAIIQSSCDLMLRYGDRMPSDDRLHRMERIIAHVNHLNSLIDTAVKATRPGGLSEIKPEPVNVVRFTEDLIGEMRLIAEPTHTIELTFEGDCDTSTFDPHLVRLALTNLVTNAVKYSPEGGQVTVMVICAPHTLHYMVADQGMGIALEDQQHIFDSFYRAKDVQGLSGTGLGLALARRAAELHGGRITVYSVPGEGALFDLTLSLNMLDD